MFKLTGICCAALLMIAGCASNTTQTPLTSSAPTASTSPAPTTTPTVRPSGSSAAGSASPTYDDKGTRTFTSETFAVDISLGDFFFSPTFVKSPGGAEATVKLHNAGSTAHTFTSDTLKFDEELAPGATKTITVKIGTESRYEFVCRFHADQGMRGAFQPH